MIEWLRGRLLAWLLPGMRFEQCPRCGEIYSLSIATCRHLMAQVAER